MNIKTAVATLIAFLPPTAVAVLRPKFLTAHPLASILILIAYGIACLVAGFSAKVYKDLEVTWAGRVAAYLDQASRQYTSQTLRKYLKYIQEFHRDVNLGGLAIRAPHSLPVTQVFVDLSLVSASPHELSSDLLGMTDASVNAAKDREPQAIRKSIWEFLTGDGNTRLAIIGAPGSGKSTLLAHVALTIANRHERRRLTKLRRKIVPIILYLRELSDHIYREQTVSLAQIILMSLKALPQPPTTAWIEGQLKSGRCIVMFDGLDEVALEVQRHQIIDWVQSQIVNYPQNSFIITSRPFGYKSHPLNAASILQVRALSRQQIRRFVELWSLAAELRAAERDNPVVREIAKTKADDLLKRLADPSLHYLAANPLLLTMIAHLHYYGGALPSSRAQLYQEICKVFLGRRQESKNLLSEQLTISQKEAVLRHLALNMMLTHKHDLPRASAEDLIRPILHSVMPDLPPSDFLTHIQNSSGLLAERESGVIAFVHETIQEYLASAQIRERQELDILTRNVWDIWWRDVILLYCAEADAGPIVVACLRDGTPSAIALAADCAESARELSPDERERVERALSYQGVSSNQGARAVIGSALLTRKVRRVLLLENGAYVVAAPISAMEYGLYTEHRASLGDEPATRRVGSRALTKEPGDEPVRGVSARDAVSFAEWITRLVSDGWSYRLPYPEEARDRIIDQILGESDLSFYTAKPTNTDGQSSGGLVIGMRPGRDDRLKAIFDRMLNQMDWPTIWTYVDELTPRRRSLLEDYWIRSRSSYDSDAVATFRPWPMKGSVAELLRLLALSSVLEEQDARWFLGSLERRFHRSVDEFLELTELLENRALTFDRQRVSSGASPHGTPPDSERQVRLRKACYALQLRLDVFRYANEFKYISPVLTSNDWLFNFPIMSYAPGRAHAILESVCFEWKFGINFSDLLKHADRAREIVNGSELWEGFNSTYRARREWLIQLLNAATRAISELATERLDVSDQTKARARVRLACMTSLSVTFLLVGQLPGPMPGHDDGSGVQKLAQLREIYSHIISSMIDLEWRVEELIEATEAIVLVRE
jgi:energy-coupling factor transporter ATP-binding protein EcfA2